MKKAIIILVVVIPLLILGYFIWKTVSRPVLYDREIPSQEITQWQSLEKTRFTLHTDIYTLTYQGDVVLGITGAGPTVMVLLDDGNITVHPDRFEQSGILHIRNGVEMGDEEPVFDNLYTFNNAIVRINPRDRNIPSGSNTDNDTLLNSAQSMYRQKHSRYLVDNDKVRIPKEHVRVIDMGIGEKDLLIIDSDIRKSLFYIQTD